MRYRPRDKGELLADRMMRAVTRRSAFRVLGLAGGAVTGAFLGSGLIGKGGRALAAPMTGGPQFRIMECPGGTAGPCSCKSSACIAAGERCSCICPGDCDCSPEAIYASCAWLVVGDECVFACDCYAC